MSSTISSRRAFLRGAGVTLALPLLESLMPARAFAQAAAAPKRLMYWFIPNGVLYNQFFPAAAGPLDAKNLPPLLQPLADSGVVGDVTVISGLDNLSGWPVAVGDHASGLAAMMTCVPAKKAALSDLGLGISADQVAANSIGKLAARPSLELGMAKSGSTGNCDNGYACPYAQAMSWQDATTPRPKRTDPHDAWLYLLGTDGMSSPDLSAAQRDLMRKGDKSVLDYVLAQSAELSKRIGADDRIKLEQYLTAVRTTETQLTSMVSVPTSPSCQGGTGPTNSSDYITRLNAMMDVMEFAFKCDLTRVITFMFGNAFGPGPMPWVTYNGAPVTSDYHGMTHAMGTPGNPEKVAACIKWEVSIIASFVKRLKAIPEGDKTVLYNTSFMTQTDVGEGAPHNHDKMPVILAGNGGGTMPTSGRHLHYDPEDPNARKLAGTRNLDNRTKALAIPNTNRIANLHLSILKNAGVQVDKFGDSNGPLNGL